MQTAQKLGVLTIALAMVTTVSLPNRQFAKVVDAFGRFVQGTLGVAMGTRTTAAS
jgi:hypothetical protein